VNALAAKVDAVSQEWGFLRGGEPRCAGGSYGARNEDTTHTFFTLPAEQKAFVWRSEAELLRY